MLLPARITKRKNIEYAIAVTRSLRDLGLRRPPARDRTARAAQRPLGRLRRRATGRAHAPRRPRRGHLPVRGAPLRRPPLEGDRSDDGRPLSARRPPDLSERTGRIRHPAARSRLVRLPGVLLRHPTLPRDRRRRRPTIRTRRAASGDRSTHRPLLETDQPTRLRREVLRRFSWERVFRERIAPLLTEPVASEGGSAHPDRATPTLHPCSSTASATRAEMTSRPRGPEEPSMAANPDAQPILKDTPGEHEPVGEGGWNGRCYPGAGRGGGDGPDPG